MSLRSILLARPLSYLRPALTRLVVVFHKLPYIKKILQLTMSLRLQLYVYYESHIKWKSRAWMLKFTRWYRDEFKFKQLFPRLLVMTAVSLVMLAGVLNIQHIFRPDHDNLPWLIEKIIGKKITSAPEWRDLSQLTVLLISAPFLFLIWAYRDANTRANIENARKDTNLKDFHQIEQWVAGIGSDDDNVNVTLQTAGIYQLNEFIQGNYGASFRRPAFELIKAKLQPLDDNLDYKLARIKCGIQNRISWLESTSSVQARRITRKHINDYSRCIKRIIDNYVEQLPVNNRTSYSLLKENNARLFHHHNLFPFKNICLPGIELYTELLIGIRIENAQLQGADFHEAKLQGANLVGAKLQGVNLHGAELQGADLHSAQLQSAYLVGAKLQGVDLVEAQLEGADLFGAQLQGARLFRAGLQGANLGDARLQGADLHSSQLQSANLRMARLQGVDLVGARLQGADLGGARLQSANLRSTQLRGAYLFLARLQGADLGSAELQGAVLCWARLQGANLRSANLQDANLGSAELQGAVLCWARLQGANLGSAQLQSADLSGADLQGADLRNILVDSETTFTDNDQYAVYDDTTLFGQYDVYGEYTKDELQEFVLNHILQLKSLGLRHKDEVDQD